ncbi:MAG: N-acetyltransferase family protein [Ferruginibacter sp.]
MKIIEMLPEHWDAVRQIYREGIDTGHATFETSVPGWKDWDNSHLKEPRIISIEGSEILGWGALTPVSGRCIYAGVAEISVYIRESARGKGLGKMLLQALIDKSEELNLWTLQAGIFLENIASVKMHEASGFRIVGLRERIGRMNGQWRDTLLLERRSNASQFI